MSADGPGDDGGDTPAAPADPRYDPRFQRGHASAAAVVPAPPIAPAERAAGPEVAAAIVPRLAAEPSPAPESGLPPAPDSATSVAAGEPDPDEPDPDATAPVPTERARRALIAVSVLLVALGVASWGIALVQRDPFATRYSGWDFWRDQVVLPTAPALAAAGILGLALWLAIEVVAPRRPRARSTPSGGR